MPTLSKPIGAVLCLVFALCFAAPNAHADSFTPSFTCPGGGSGCFGPVLLPTAPDVTFPSPTFTITFDLVTFSLTLSAVDLPGDTYNWHADTSGFGPASSLFDFDITDTTTHESTNVSFGSTDNPFQIFGLLTFTAVPTATPTPEPSSLALMLAGVGLVLMVRKKSR